MKKEHMGFYAQPEKKTPEDEKPSMFLRKTPKGGLYFFSPNKTFIFFLSAKHVQELLDGKRKFACIHKEKVRHEERPKDKKEK